MNGRKLRLIERTTRHQKAVAHLAATGVRLRPLSAMNTGLGVGPAGEINSVGLRIARVIPEPNSRCLALLCLISLRLVLLHRHR